jgi:hypothetical protein
MWSWVLKGILKITWLDLNSKAINWHFSKQFKGAGKVIDLKIDFKEKKAKCELKLNGENELVKLSLDGFELITTGDEYFINITSAKISREWLQTLVNQFAVGKPIKINESIYKTLTGMFGK